MEIFSSSAFRMSSCALKYKALNISDVRKKKPEVRSKCYIDVGSFEEGALGYAIPAMYETHGYGFS